MTELKTTEPNSDTRMCSFNIGNMYKNIPRKDITHIINNILDNNNKIQVNNQKEITCILKTVMEQNYFQFDQKYYKQTEGLAMGAPSAIVAEIFIQHMDHKHLHPILKT
jgi:hypothetical protein